MEEKKKNIGFIIAIILVVIVTVALVGISIPLIFSNNKKEVKKSQEVSYNLQDHLELGDYKGIEVKIPNLEFTEDDVLNYMKAHLEDLGKELISYKTSDRTTVREGDLVDINFTGFHNEEAFEGGSSENFMLNIGAGEFIEGFEEGLIGAEVASEVTLNLKFPEEYHEEKLAGEEVVFLVKINSLQEVFTEEVNDDIVQEYTEHKNLEEYKEEIRKVIKENLEEKEKSEIINQAFASVIENSKIISYPQELLNKQIDDMNAFYRDYAVELGMEFEELAYSYMTESKEEYDEIIDESAKEQVFYNLVIEAIANKEGIKLFKTEFDEGVEKLIKIYGPEEGLDKVEDFYEIIPRDEIIDSILWEKTMDFIVEKANIVRE